MQELLARLIQSGGLTDTDSEEIKGFVETINGVGAIVRMLSETQGAKDIVASFGNIVGGFYNNLTKEQKIPKDIAAQIMVGIRHLPTTATAKKN